MENKNWIELAGTCRGLHICGPEHERVYRLSLYTETPVINEYGGGAMNKTWHEVVCSNTNARKLRDLHDGDFVQVLGHLATRIEGDRIRYEVVAAMIYLQ